MSTSACSFAELSIERTLHHDLRCQRKYDVPVSKTKRSLNTYFKYVFHEWDMLDEAVRNSATMAEFKCKLLTSIRQVKHSLFGLVDIVGVKTGNA